MRIALIGYGAVAAIHARKLERVAEVAIYGPNPEKAEAFAAQHGIRRAGANWNDVLYQSDAVVICSPSPAHYEQTKDALLSGRHTLVEFPACTALAEARDLGVLASERSVILQCAHTSRHLEPYKRLRVWLQERALGEILHVHYIRLIPLRVRSWKDDALWHHAGHALDLFLYWFGSLRPLACSAHPGVPGAQDISLVACTRDGAPIAITISYDSCLPEAKMTLIGSKHTVATDGFSYISSDNSRFVWKGDERGAYEGAIEEQDLLFISACQGLEAGTPWRETVELSGCISEFVNLWNQQ